MKTRIPQRSSLSTADSTLVEYVTQTEDDARVDLRSQVVTEQKTNKLPKVIAFYLPQFHPVKENDEWWGAGFTEWTNVTKAKSYYRDHYQPHLPADLGFYDLRVAEIKLQQAELAKKYGVYGFCYYYYWFSGRKILERPVTDMLKSGNPSLPFCLCWANENWTRRWDGDESEILLEQKYRAEDPPLLIQELAPFFADPRYIRIDGKPLLIVYRPSIVPETLSVTKAWRQEAQRLGIGELHLCGALTFGQQDPRPLGFDSAVEFPPHGVNADPLPPDEVGMPSEFTGAVYSYPEAVLNEIRKEPYSFKTFRAAMPSWDNSPRTGLRGHMFKDADPTKFGVWMQHLVSEAVARGSEFVFVNAWNEWAEGAHLEPDQRFGHQWLEAISNALGGKSTAQVCIEVLSAHIATAPASVRLRLAELNDAMLSFERMATVAAKLFRTTVPFAQRFAPLHFSSDLPAAIAGLPFLPAGRNQFDALGAYSGRSEAVARADDTIFVRGWTFAPSVPVSKDTPIVFIMQHNVTKMNYFAISNERLERPDIVEFFENSAIEDETRFSGFESSLSTRGVPAGRYRILVGTPTQSMVAVGTQWASLLIEDVK